MKYNWQYSDWAKFVYSESILDSLLVEFASEIGEIKGIIQSLSNENQQDTILQMMISEAVKTSEIEGEFFSRQDIMSSIKRHLDVSENLAYIRDKKALGVGSLMVEIRKSYQKELTEEMIKFWHEILMKANLYINAGAYRTGKEPMQIISGAFGKETIHYEAPPSEAIPLEMKNFVKWYNEFKINPSDIKNILINLFKSITC